jgi:superfamily II DNA or RNA helicase
MSQLLSRRTAIPTSIAELRPHQVSLLGDLDRALAEARHVVVQAPTGYGKTIVAATLAKRVRDDGRRTLFTVPALSLIDQTVEKFQAEGVTDIGVIQADHEMTDWSQPVQIASVQTLMRRQMPPIDMVIVDEVHRWYDKYEEWLQGPWKHLPVIGLTATPWTRGLGKHFDRLIVGATTRQLIEDKYLSPFRVFAPASPDLTGVRTLGGDYREDDLANAMDRAGLVADVVDTWIDRAAGRPTLLFAVNRAHAKHLQEKFIEAGVAAGYIDCFTEADERKEIARQFHADEIKVVCNVGCLTTGIDWDIRCIILARPTKSEILFVQMIGRGLRTADGKADCLVLDHSDNHIRLGFVTDIHYNELDDGRPRPKVEATGRLPKPCPRCTFLKPPQTLACPCCGFMPVRQNTVTSRNGQLVELALHRKAKLLAEGEQITFYSELRAIERERGYKSGWAGNSYKAKFGIFPPWNWRDFPTLRPSASTLSWVKSQQIAFAKARRI